MALMSPTLSKPSGEIAVIARPATDSGTASPISPRPPRTNEPPTRPRPITASTSPTEWFGFSQPPVYGAIRASVPAVTSAAPTVTSPTLDRRRWGSGGSGVAVLGSGRSQANGAAPSGSQVGGVVGIGSAAGGGGTSAPAMYGVVTGGSY